MCDCLEKYDEAIVKDYAEKGKVVEDVEFKGAAQYCSVRTGEFTGYKTKTDVRIVFAKGKPENTYLRHNFCPFCGESYSSNKGEVR